MLVKNNTRVIRMQSEIHYYSEMTVGAGYVDREDDENYKNRGC